MTTVALDGRGADRGAGVIVAGARAAAADGIGVRVFGPAAELAELAGVEGVEVVDTDEAITNDEEPVGAVRSKQRASVVLAGRDVAEGRSDALASAGPTGATMTAALFALKRVHGVRRPALAVQILVPGREAPTVLLDAGANAEVRAGDLVQFAYLGAAFAEAVLGIGRPRVALLSVGEEARKGTQALVDAHGELVPATMIDFRGNVEGRDLLSGVVDVIVTDGFTGNVALKTVEGTAQAVADAVREAARSGPIAALGGLLLRPALGGLRRAMDPDNTGGAILLGIDGVAVVGHGSSGPTGVANAIRLAARAVEERAVERTAALLERSGATRSGLRDRKVSTSDTEATQVRIEDGTRS
ncbi:MAG TPA: phosphate acyltransferase PlsX [Solirubrobacterales bacterium]|nr:phosphate acyltransferase PlsX [Solirubrobacterales bacterium]